jgi:hypothetical protein
MKLNYTSIQHSTIALEAQVGAAAGAGADAVTGELRVPGGAVAVIALHGQLAPLAWSLGQARPGFRLGYVQTAGGALPGSHSSVVRTLREQGLLAAHVTAGPCYGGPDGDAVTTIGGLHHGLAVEELDAVVCGPGPGIIGSGSTLGHGGMAALESTHAALAVGAGTLVVPRMSTGDRRERHQGISHHSRTVLELLLGAVSVALPPDVDPPAWGARHTWVSGRADLTGYAASGLPASTMGRSLELDPIFFAVALAAGEILAGM